ncbi:carcinoembryonic antigen-related cell adhesion molecule 1-like [Arapaima gigas]
MTIGTVEKGDTGRYECRLSNPASSSSAECTVTVNYGPESVRIQGENTVWIDTKVEFQCSASSEPPADFSWTFNRMSTGVKTAVFTIERATRNNTGNYVCVASNVVTTLTSSSTVHTLVVRDGVQNAGRLSGGAIAGIVVGVLLAFVLGFLAGFFIKKKRREVNGGPSSPGEWDCAVKRCVTCILTLVLSRTASVLPESAPQISTVTTYQ